MNFMIKLNRFIFDVFLDTLFPKRCINCKRTMPVSENFCLCKHCQQELKKTKIFVHESENGYDEIISPLPYRGNIRSSLLDFKFKNLKYLGYTFARIMYDELKNRSFVSSDCYILSVPIHISRDRDYNQSAVLAKHLSSWLGIDILDDALYKIKPISRLSGMGLDDKKLYIKNSFLYNPCINLSGKTVIVVDDVYTSGTTLLEISKYLRMYGAERVYAVTACHSRW